MIRTIILHTAGAALLMMACVVNNNHSPGATGTISPQTSVDPQVGVTMPGGSTQVDRAGSPPSGAASSAPSAPPEKKNGDATRPRSAHDPPGAITSNVAATPPPSLPGARQRCEPTTGCSTGLACVESFEEQVGNTPSEEKQVYTTGQRGQFDSADIKIDTGGDCPVGTRRYGAPIVSKSSSTTCAATWKATTPSDCAVHVEASHGLGKWHCDVYFRTVPVTKRSTGFSCQ